MKTSSAKAKGRRAQQLVRDALALLGEPYGLEPGDVESTSMGANGVDVKLSPAAKRIFGDWAIECKNVESLNVPKVFAEHAAKYPGKLPVVVHTRNNADVLVTVRLPVWLALLKASKVEYPCERSAT